MDFSYLLLVSLNGLMLNMLPISMGFSCPPSVSLDGYDWADGSGEVDQEATRTANTVATAVSILTTEPTTDMDYQ